MHRPTGRVAVPCAAIATAMLLPAPAAHAEGVPPASDPGTAITAAGDALAGDPAPIDAPLPAVPAVPLATAASGCAHATARPSRLSRAAARAALLCELNRARSAHGLGPLHGNRRVRRAAGRHARDMVRRGYFAHQRPGGPSLMQRLRNAGWRGRAAGEAIAWGCGRPASAAATVRSWLNSPPHRAILLSGSYSQAGIGVARRAPASCGPGATWVLDAARP